MPNSSTSPAPRGHHAALAASLLVVGLSACEPPDLPVDTGSGAGTGEVAPNIAFVFPHNGMSEPVCSTFFVAVDIDGIEVVDWNENPEPAEGQGHWHLTDEITGDYYALQTPYGSIQADLNDQESRNYSLSATLNNNDHTPLDPGDNPGALDFIEFVVSDSDDCIGGGGGGMEEY